METRILVTAVFLSDVGMISTVAWINKGVAKATPEVYKEPLDLEADADGDGEMEEEASELGLAGPTDPDDEYDMANYDNEDGTCSSVLKN